MITAGNPALRAKAHAPSAAIPDFRTFPFLNIGMIYGIIAYCDIVNAFAFSSLGTGAIFKYGLLAVLIVVFISSARRTSALRIGFNAPTIYLAFTVASSLPLLYQIITGQSSNSFFSAFISTLAFSMAVVSDDERYTFDGKVIANILQSWLLMLGVIYVIELAIRKFSGIPYFAQTINMTNHVKSVALVSALALAILSPRKGYLLGTLATIALSLWLRPSSSVVFTSLLVIPTALLLRARLYALTETMVYLIFATFALMPFLLHYSNEARELVVNVESAAKQGALGGHSNTEVRLTLLDLAFERFEASSPVFGEFFTGGTNVLAATRLSFWRNNFSSGLAQVHSDYLIVLFQSGIIGYMFFNATLVLIARARFRVLRRMNRFDPRYALVALGIPLAVIVGAYCSSNPFLQVYNIAFIAWFLLFCSEVALRHTVKGM